MLAGDMRPARPPCISSDRAWARPNVFDVGRVGRYHVCCHKAQQRSYGTASTSDRADAAATAIRAAASLADMERAVMQHWQDMDSTSAHHAFVCMYKILNKQQKYKQKVWRNAAWRPSRPFKLLHHGSRIHEAPHMGPNGRSRVHIPMDLYSSDEHNSSQPTGRSREATAQKLPGQTDTASSSSTTINNGMQANQTSRKRSSKPGQSSSMGITADRDPQAELSSMQRLLPLMLYKAGPLQQSNEYACVHMVIVLGLAHKARAFGPSPSSVPPVSPPQAAAPPTSRSVANHRSQAPSLPPLDYASAADVADTLAAAAVPQLLDFSPDCLSKLLLGLAYLELDPGADWLGLASAALISRCQRMSGWQAAATVHAFSLIGFKPHPALLHDLVKRIQQRIDQLLPKQQAVLLQSLARMGFKPRPTWLRVFVQASISKLSGLSILMLANMVEAFGQMRYQPPPMWLKAMFRCSLGVLHLAPQRDAAALLYWVCRHNIAMPPGWLHETLLQARGVRCWPPATLLNRAQQTRGQQAEPQGQGSSGREQLGDKGQGLQGDSHPQEQAGWYPGLQRPQLLTQVASPADESGSLPLRNDPQSSTRGTDGNEASAAAQVVLAAHVSAAAKGLDTCSLVQLLYMIAKERDDSRVADMSNAWLQAVHVTWAIKQLKALLRAEASNAKHTHRRRRNKAAISTGQLAVGASSDAASAGREGCAGDAGPLPAHAEDSGAADAANAASGPSSASQAHRNATAAVSTQSTSPVASTASTARPSAAAAAAAAPLSALSPQLLVDLLYVMAELGQQPPTAARRSLMTRLQAAMPSFTTNNCTTAMVCLAVLNITPDAAWEEAFFARVLQLMATFKPQELANVLTAAGYLYLDPGQPLLAAVAARLSAFDLVELAMFVRKLEQATAPPKRSGSAAVLGTDWLLGLKRSAKRMFAAKA